MLSHYFSLKRWFSMSLSLSLSHAHTHLQLSRCLTIKQAVISCGFSCSFCISTLAETFMVKTKSSIQYVGSNTFIILVM